MDKRGNGNANELERWIKPEEGWFKVNCDGAFDSMTKATGTSIIVRSSEGAVVDGINGKKMADSVLMAETMALKDGIGLVIERK